MEDHQKEIWKRFKDSPNFAMYLICEDEVENRPNFVRLIGEYGIKIPYAFDSDEQIYRLFVTPNGSVTRTVVISPDWKIASLHEIHTWRDMFEIRRCVRKLSKVK